MAIGHSSAESEHFFQAVAAGASHITHLWSGMSNLLRRVVCQREGTTLGLVLP
jgi:N-acetylglucosamine-6-phosphate deacetylase